MNDTAGQIWQYLRSNPSTYSQLMNHFNLKRKTIEAALTAIRKSGRPLKKTEAPGRKNYIYSCPTNLEELVHRSSYQPPTSSMEHPQKISVKDYENPKIVLANSVYAGGLTNAEAFKNLLRWSENDKVDAIILPGNIIWMDLLRYSKNKARRSNLSSVNTDSEKIEYPKHAARLLDRNPKKLLEEGRPVYITFKERLDMVIEQALTPLFIDEHGDPLYKGNFYMTLGHIEEDLILAHVNDVVRIEIVKESNHVETEKAKLRRLGFLIERCTSKLEQYTDEKLEVKDKLTELEEVGDEEPKDEIKKLERRLHTINGRIQYYQKKAIGALGSIKNSTNETIDIKQIDSETPSLEELVKNLSDSAISIQEEISDLAEYKNRIIMTNTNDEFINLASQTMMGYIIDRLEGAIPNCTVVSKGTGYFRIKDKIIKVIHSADKMGNKASEKLMSPLAGKMIADLAQGGWKGEPAPDIVIGGGLSSTYTHRPIGYEGKDGLKTINVIQAPTFLDIEGIKTLYENEVKPVDVARLPDKGDLITGALSIEFVYDNLGHCLPVRKLLRTDMLTNPEIFKSDGTIEHQPIMYFWVVSDHHILSRYCALVETPNTIEHGYVSTQRFLREINAPLVTEFSLGDEDQGKNYPTEEEDHPDRIRTPEALELILSKNIIPLTEENIEQLSKEEILKIVKQNEITIAKITKLNKFREGILMPGQQMDYFLECVDYELLERVIENGKKTRFFGPALTIINGNHNRNTTAFYITSELIRMGIIREMSTGDPERRKELERKITAPMLGLEGILAGGLFGIVNETDVKMDDSEAIHNEELYGMYLRHKQRGGKKDGDTMKGMRDSFLKRGQAFPELQGRDFLVAAAHDHMGGETATSSGFFIKGRCFMERNGYGEALDFGPPTMGSIIAGFPAGGKFKNGPIVTIDLPIEYIRHWAMTGAKLPTEKLFKDDILKKITSSLNPKKD